MTRYQTTRRRIGAFSLIEVVLAIGLSTVLLALLASAINLFLLRVDASGEDVRRGQLARSVIRLISDDLRCAAMAYEQDTSATTSLAATQATYDVDELDQLGQTEPTEPVSTRRLMGLYGDGVSVSIDVNKARATDPVVSYGADEVQSASASLRGVTTVRYYVTADGLNRQEARRDIDVYEYDQGGSPTLEASNQVIAPEVAGIQFLYSDGEQTLSAWDTEEQDGLLPVAVEVEITFRDAPTSDQEQASAEQYSAQRFVVALPEVIPPAIASLGEEAGL